MLLFTLIAIAPIVLGGKLNETQKHEVQNVTSSTLAPISQGLNVTKINMVSEGGSSVTQSPDLTIKMPNSVQTLLSLDKELGKGKESPSVARKSALPEATSQAPVIHNNGTSTKNVQFTNHTTSTNTSSTASTVQVLPNISPKSNTMYTTMKPVNTTVHKIVDNITTTTTKAPVQKPTITSYEQLVNAANNQSQLKILFNDKESTEPAILRNKGNLISYKNRNESNPGMVMPVVITILVVPVFAVLGYLALKRGHEAWKNRHYKRMDFLLDGMYND